MIEYEKEKSPVHHLRNDSETIGNLISFLIEHDEHMSKVLDTAMSRITSLEYEIERMKNNG